MSDDLFHIKCRENGKKRFSFLSRKGCNYLRIHAMQFEKAKADSLIVDARKDNPNWEFKVVPL